MVVRLALVLNHDAKLVSMSMRSNHMTKQYYTAPVSAELELEFFKLFLNGRIKLCLLQSYHSSYVHAV